MKGLLVLSHDVEDIEALGTRDLLMRAGLEVVTATFEKTLSVNTAYGLSIKADKSAKDVAVEDFDFLVIPGGPYVAKKVEKEKNIKRLAKEFTDRKKLVAAICAGPRFLAQAGLLDGKRFTAFPGSEKDAPNGVYRPEKKALTHKGIITARGPGAVYDFAYEIVKELLGRKKAQTLLKEIQY